MADNTPKFEHPQSQSMQPAPGQVYSPTPDLTSLPQAHADLRQYIDQQIKTHIHNGTVAVRINANTDIIGTLPVPYYSGYVVSGGTKGVPFPAGWSIIHNGTGDDTIGHNINSTSYIVLATSAGVTSIPTVVARNSTSFRITFTNLSNIFTNTDYSFFVLPT